MLVCWLVCWCVGGHGHGVVLRFLHGVGNGVWRNGWMFWVEWGKEYGVRPGAWRHGLVQIDQSMKDLATKKNMDAEGNTGLF